MIRWRWPLSDVWNSRWVCFLHTHITLTWPLIAWHIEYCVLFHKYVCSLLFCVHYFCIFPGALSTHTHAHPVCLTRQSGVSLVAVEEPCLLLSWVCVPATPHNHLLHVMSAKALILWRCALWGELRDTPGRRGSKKGGEKGTTREKKRGGGTEEQERKLGVIVEGIGGGWGDKSKGGSISHYW